jgi:hypothetical protein
MERYVYSRIKDCSRKRFTLSADESAQIKSIGTNQPAIDDFWKSIAEKNHFDASTLRPINNTQFTAVSTLPEDADFQVAVRFRAIDKKNPSGDCNFYYQILKSWTPVEEKQWLDDTKKGALEAFLVDKLSFAETEFNVKSWVDVSVIFHLSKDVVKMSVYTNDENANPVHRRSFLLSESPFKDMSFIYFQLLKDWKVLRKANFSKDFLNAETIMHDEREDLIRIYLAGGKIQIPGMQDPIVMPGNLDIVSEKHKLQWDNIAFIFFKKDEESKPELGIYEVAKTEEQPGYKFELKETVDIFSLKVADSEPADEVKEEVVGTDKEK